MSGSAQILHKAEFSALFRWLQSYNSFGHLTEDEWMKLELASQLEALHPDAFGWSLHCCGGDVPRAEDVLQNAYLKVAQGRAQFSGRSSLKTWWFGVIRFTAREELRRNLVRNKLHLRLLLQAAPPGPDAASPARQLEVDEQATLLRSALNRLPRRQAEVLHLVFYQDLALSAVAEVLGISLGSVRQHYDRGKSRLRELLPIHETISSP